MAGYSGQSSTFHIRIEVMVLLHANTSIFQCFLDCSVCTPVCMLVPIRWETGHKLSWLDSDDCISSFQNHDNHYLGLDIFFSAVFTSSKVFGSGAFTSAAFFSAVFTSWSWKRKVPLPIPWCMWSPSILAPFSASPGRSNLRWRRASTPERLKNWWVRSVYFLYVFLVSKNSRFISFILDSFTCESVTMSTNNW